jgi:hypothetical protein
MLPSKLWIGTLVGGWVLAWTALGSARAGDVTVVPVTAPLPFFEAADSNRQDTAIEASGVEPIGDGRLLLVAHDKEAPLRVVEVATGRQIGPPLTSQRFPGPTITAPKWEGMARDSAGFYYVVGSHSGATDIDRDAHAQLFRFRLLERTSDSGAPLAIDEASVVSWRIAGPLVKALQREGLGDKAVDKRKVEGLTIRESAGRRELVLGLREPDDLVRVFAADITTLPAPDAKLPLTRLFAFPAGERAGVRLQLTSLEYLPAWKGFLVVTATEDDRNVFHGNALWFVSDSRIHPGQTGTIEAEPLWTFEDAMKAEGLCILNPAPQAEQADVVHLLLTYDNDPKATRIPSRFQRVDLRRRTESR